MSLRWLLILWCLSACAAPLAHADQGPTISAEHGAVVSVSREASLVGVATLREGGNAVDAAVATAFALAVTYPAAGNIGGGGYLLVAGTDDAPQAVFDFREVAPAAATENMFVDPAGRTPHRRVGVPGTVRGLALAHQRLGKRPWRSLVLPAVLLARDGFAIDTALADDLNRVLARSDAQQFANLHAAFDNPSGRPWQAGDKLVQRQLADVLERIANQGPEGFYTGPTAELIVAEMKRGGGILTAADLAAYRPIERKPLQGTYRGYEVLSVPPSSSGGTTLIEALNLLETFDLRAMGPGSVATTHHLIECMKRAYRDRAAYLGDPATNENPPELITKAYAQRLAGKIDPNRATPSVDLAGDIPISQESESTTHLSVIDSQRLAVSLTYTLENHYGGRVVVAGGGFLLNDEMNDFNWLPGVTNQQGRIGTKPNLLAPGKRMLSSMCPTILRKQGKVTLVTGSPGGRTIINTVLQMVVNTVDFEQDLRAAVDAPRLHHQWLPDEVRLEPAWQRDRLNVIAGLQQKGHTLAERPQTQGDAHSIFIDSRTSRITAAADCRISGSAAGY